MLKWWIAIGQVEERTEEKSYKEKSFMQSFCIEQEYGEFAVG